MSFGANPLLKKEFIKYVLENNILRLNNIKLSEKIYKIFGSTRNYKKEAKLTQTDANNMLKRVSSNQLSSKVRTLKAENRRLRHFNRKFKDTLATGIRWENAVDSVETMSKSMSKSMSHSMSHSMSLSKGKKKKSLGKRKGKSRGKSRRHNKKGGKRRKTRRKSKRRRR